MQKKIDGKKIQNEFALKSIAENAGSLQFQHFHIMYRISRFFGLKPSLFY